MLPNSISPTLHAYHVAKKIIYQMVIPLNTYAIEDCLICVLISQSGMEKMDQREREIIGKCPKMKEI